MARVTVEDCILNIPNRFELVITAAQRGGARVITAGADVSDAPEPYLLAGADVALLGEVAGKRVLEVGCGQAACARWLTAQGADAVAMDLSAGSKRLWVLMEHTTKDGLPRIVSRCAYPLTAASVVKRVYTNLAVIDVTERGFEVLDMAPGVTLESLQACTDAKLWVAG